jgi:hypothetical protein
VTKSARAQRECCGGGALKNYATYSKHMVEMPIVNDVETPYDQVNYVAWPHTSR